MKKMMMAMMAAALAGVFVLAGCGEGGGKIHVVSREDGSGTRGAFIELTGIQAKKGSERVDRTTSAATVSNSTAVVLSTVKDDTGAIGYISLGSLDKSVKAVKVDGVAPSVKTVKDGSYHLSRPFNIVTKGNLSTPAKDFIAFILSADGQKVIEKNGYIAVATGSAYAGAKPAGKVTVGGSSSVTPVMEKLKEAYQKVNPNAKIEVQESDSSTGIAGAAEGTFDIGMASRELEDDERAKGIKTTKIAMDGIAVIVNRDNRVEALTTQAICNIYTGKTTDWRSLQ
jgi:phosphate transport system substrate-binding protein